MNPIELGGVILAWGGVVVGTIIWSVRQEGRVNSLDERFVMLKDYLDHIDSKLDRLIDRMPTPGRDLR